MKISKMIADYIYDIKFESIPGFVIEEKKKNILDILGVMTAGASGKGCHEVICEITDWAGRKDATIFQHDCKVPAHNAALANCMMARALDFDDVFTDSIIHINATNVPVAFLMAEFRGNVSGQKFLSAITLGADLSARMGLANNVPSNISGYSFTFQFGSIIAAIVASRLMGLTPNQINDAIGIAYSQLAGNNQGYVDGAMTIRLQQGLSAAAGVLGALMAEKGITGAKDIFEGKFGYYNVFAGGDYNRQTLIQNLGHEFYGVKHTTKPYPCCTHLHGAIEGIDKIIKENKIVPKDVESIRIGINQSAYNICCIPEESKKRPQTVVDLQFSYNFVISAMLFENKLDLDSFNESYLKRNDILDFGQSKIETYVNANSSRDNKSITDTELALKTIDGNVFKEQIPFPHGSKEKPMTFEQCVQKFKMCVEKAKKHIPDRKVERIIEMIENFEKLENVMELYGMFD